MQNKPNFRKAKMKLNFYSAKGYENEPPLRTPRKQTQSNPTCSELVEPISKGATMPLCGGANKSDWSQSLKLKPKA